MEANFSDELLAKVKEYSSYLMRPDQIAILVNIDPDSFKRFLRAKNHPVWLAYEAGKSETILAIRKQEVELAKLGSPMAIDMVNKFIIDQEISEE